MLLQTSFPSSAWAGHVYAFSLVNFLGGRLLKVTLGQRFSDRSEVAAPGPTSAFVSSMAAMESAYGSSSNVSTHRMNSFIRGGPNPALQRIIGLSPFRSARSCSALGRGRICAGSVLGPDPLFSGRRFLAAQNSRSVLMR